MINLHLNGDIVRCPDVQDAKKRLAERRESEYKCKYGIIEYDCQTRNNYHLRHRITDKRCDCHSARCRDYKEVTDGGMVWKMFVCPHMNLQYIHSLKKKSYFISSQTYRKMASASHDLVKSSRNRVLFLTLTFPKFKIEPNEQEYNECFSRFLHNLRQNYGCSGYVGVRERGEDNNRVHFHLLLSIPYYSFVTLNAAWCHAIQHFCDFSPLALRTTKQSLYIKNPIKAIRYFCKYFAKSRYQKSNARLVFISNNLIKEPIKIYKTNPRDLLSCYKGVYIQQTSDFTTCYRITNDKSFMEYCNNFLYDAFEKAYNFPLFTRKMANFCVPGPDY